MRTHKQEVGLAWQRNNKEKVALINKRWRLNHPHKAWAINTLRQHRDEGCKINITTVQLERLALKTKSCFYCDATLKFGPKRGSPIRFSPSLDRVNSRNSLSLRNIVICCYRCNVTKQDRTLKEFIKYCLKISKKFKGRI